MNNQDYKELDIHIKLGFGSAPVYQQIIEEVIRLISTGVLRSEDRLPPVRELAKQLNVNPNTAAKAYTELIEKKYITSNKGGGTFPTKNIDENLKQKKIDEICKRVAEEVVKYNIPLEVLIESIKKTRKMEV